MEPKVRHRPRSVQGDRFNIYEREILRELNGSCHKDDNGKVRCTAKSTNRIAKDTCISWQTTENYLQDLFNKGLVAMKKEGNKNLWKLNI